MSHTLDTPENIAEARRRIEAVVTDHERRAAVLAGQGNEEGAHQRRLVARVLRRDLLGDGTCRVAAFDERRPQLAETEAQITCREATLAAHPNGQTS